MCVRQNIQVRSKIQTGVASHLTSAPRFRPRPALPCIYHWISIIEVSLHRSSAAAEEISSEQLRQLSRLVRELVASAIA